MDAYIVHLDYKLSVRVSLNRYTNMYNANFVNPTDTDQ